METTDITQDVPAEPPSTGPHTLPATKPLERVEPEDDHPELGATTAEYGIVMLAAVGFAGLLVAILKSGEVKELLLGVIRTALSTG
ncbi:DUF4244 domain-containing protein [Rothia sp. HC945]|mgnify:CR=1 FL=1|uniref:DUF4244 domain-containing protein n=1 Tax=Rothia sp. HC945 TaxID=3171170 RepID=UPI00264D3A48|nr:DUF4244 domain-containing protein [Kocuria sp.]MDN5617815.1 DUF4244 domain-containing protein [Kocuria sp.]